MPSKHRQELLKKKTDYTANSGVTKQKTKASDMQNAETIKIEANLEQRLM